MHIRQQGYSIHIFDGKFEVRRSSNNQVIMIGWEDETDPRYRGLFPTGENDSCMKQNK